MKRFTFRLQRVLDLRYQREDQARRQFESVNRNCKRIEMLIQELKANRQDACDIDLVSMPGKLPIDTLRRQATLALEQKHQVRVLGLELSGFQPHLSAARDELGAAIAARRGLEYLRDQARLRWHRDQQRMERRAAIPVGT